MKYIKKNNGIYENNKIETNDDILLKRAEISSKIDNIEKELDAINNNHIIDNNVEDLKLELEKLKSKYAKYTMFVEKHIYTHKSIIKK